MRSFWAVMVAWAALFAAAVSIDASRQDGCVSGFKPVTTPEQALYYYRVRYISAYDGDSIRVDLSRGFHDEKRGLPLRMLGIDADEMNSGLPSARISRDALRVKLGAAEEIIVRTEKAGKYGRWLAEVWSHEGDECWRSVNQWMIDQGYARAYDGGRR